MQDSTKNSTESVEKNIREAFENDYPRTDQVDDTAVILRRAKREIGLRDVVGFYFSHVFRALLVVFSSVYKSTQDEDRLA